ncbi:unnamed protein product [Rotaria magnacalcarata]|uniref:Uncharacterized protein n=1 Tax=Rotaria magnacalcarata TaxID=392030 RepID=A0A816MPG6_9BILA|nr:unnamed protein product [Rotaria magnacalcarata]CAF1503130.1 unnamed protein product [Rotaria magnacalcarata]CAF2009191.1 unnamed protein product [Rotaria magnacalcarata]CAF2029619.1 unnamed protein product [Rotaria magnacalcarata]CAF2181768.1 unnamed protein product [Rotaria magnacalcarata]
MKHRGAYPTIKDVVQHYEDAQVMIARERIQICLNIVHSGVDITYRKTSIDYAIDLLPEIKAVLITTTTVIAEESASEQNKGSPNPHSSLSSSATVVTSPPSNNNNTKPRKRTHAAATNSSSTQINGCPTPMAQQLRGRKQIMNDVTSPSLNAKISSTTCDNTPQVSTSSSAINPGRKKNKSSKSITPTVYNNSESKKKVKTRRQN